MKTLDKVMHFLIHNGIMVTIGVMCLVHVMLLVIFSVAGSDFLVKFNILSVIVYILCMLLGKYGHLLTVYISIIVEVTVYTVISTYCVGLRCGTYCLLFSIVPIIIYFGTFLFKGLKRWIIILLLAINFATFVILYVGFVNVTPYYSVDPSIQLSLVILSAFSMIFATIFYNAIYIYSSELDVKDLELRNKKLSADAKEDVLTTLLNRRGFLPLVEPLMKNNKAGKFCVAFCDIDDFKKVNDSYGHDAGDEVLRHITKLMRKEMQGCDICRWGGEEIVILMKDCNIESAKERLETLRKNIESIPTVFYNKQIFVTITIGLEENMKTYKAPEDIIKAADERMYYGKQHGKNVLIFEDLS
ncbi:diguanylate cyclase (GGDEF) domain-containing protein [Lachnospiraceae bacterium]|nr:diguanylate cyclase (GGDEF) domain-containing protein [Lachnospiraceae bacterium]